MAESLEKRAENNIIESIDKLVTNSFFMLLFESLMVKNHPVINNTLKEKSIKGIYGYLNQTISNLRHIIDEGGDEKEFHLRKALQMKEKLLEIYNNVKIYISACNIIDLCLEDIFSSPEDDENGEIPLEELKRLLRQKTERLMSDAVKHDVEEAACSILFTILPNIFTDKELIDYISYSSQFYYENSSSKRGAEHINQIMKSFAPQKMPDYGKYYQKEAEKLGRVFEEIRISGFDENSKNLIKQYDAIYTKIEGIADIISSLYSELTYVTIILSSMFTFDDILKANPIYNDYYKETVEILNSAEPDEILSESLMTSLDKTIEKEVELLNELAKRKELIYKNVDFENFSENTKTLFSMEFYMTTAFFENIEDADGIDDDFTGIEEKRFIGLKAIQKEIKSLQLFIKETCLGMNENIKKSARRNLFLSVPLVSIFDKQKMIRYVDALCEKLDKASEIEDLLNSIEKIINEDVLLKLSIFEQ